MAATGGCLCGAVRYRAEGELRPVVYCHCGQCRRTHGHFAAYTAAPRDALAVEGHGLRWYESSPGFRRGFCGTCGASVFWERVGGSRVSIAAGTLDGPTGLAAERHIFVADAGDYYALPEDGLPRFPASG
jgi:hypothetical protein